MDKLIKKLLKIAKDEDCVVRLEETSNDQLWHKSIYRPIVFTATGTQSNIIVYYHNAKIKLLALAHEVGHLLDPTITTLYNKKVSFGIDYHKNPLAFERRASKWAIDFLKKNRYKELKEAKQIYSKCLETYK